MMKLLIKICSKIYSKFANLIYFFAAKIIRVAILVLPKLRKYRKKKTIVIMDRLSSAGDNGEALYHYLKQQKEFDVYYVISRWSKDYIRLRSDNHVLVIQGFKYAWTYLKTDIVLFSLKSYEPWFVKADYNKIQVKKVFLQHGVSHNDMSKRYNSSCDYDIVCVTSENEYEEFTKEKYGFTSEQIAITGFPRFDYLEKKQRKVITICLTWRKYLKRKTVEEYQLSIFNSMIENLIVKPQLMDLVSDYGYKLQFVPHPELDEEYVEYLKNKKDSRVDIITNPKYMDIISETSLLITDYSSIAFDAAYLEIPVVYYQTDIDDFYSGIHTSTKGYFNHKRDGFGEVTNDFDELLNIVRDYLNNNCVMKSLYKERVHFAFKYIDKENCLRVHNVIKDNFI